ncbi:glycerate kinase [Vibrio sp. 10N.286.49.C2]|uniref:glycerate kinase n=1 Tax=unclassified Vibrio TaxID=2614977 RepID=UPI000C852019|nr:MULTISPECIES: glycerate kinase [unclassified Vibrio]PMH27501.1 glycerate kinase [Vibrio sp. 10N.286.49.C2]PMH52927.1 glycerate kinase [Vibrio sp. 10N.286.49.B1]PMH78410.1 glycerate kinase [Vibrio sp. 10N.286.48.B7]
MKIVIAPDSYKESLTAMEVAQAIENGFQQIFPDAEYIKLPMADGGEGTVQSLIDATGGELIPVNVTGPLGAPVDGFLGIVGDGSTAVIEMAAASGIHLVPADKRDPLVTTSYGTGELIKAALDMGVRHIIVGIGGSATNDAGLGMAQALGVQLRDSNGNELGYGGGELSKLASIHTEDMDPRLSDIKLEIACDVDNPLCGPKGASAVFGPQKGATPAMVAILDTNLSHYADVIKATNGKDVKHTPGAGAAGGLGAAFLGLFNASLRPGIQIVMDAVNLSGVVKDADLVITGEGRIDSQTIHGKTPVGVARTAKQTQVPVIAIAGSTAKDCHVVYDHGIDAVYSVVLGATDLPTALKEAAFNVEMTSRNIAAALAMSFTH